MLANDKRKRNLSFDLICSDGPGNNEGGTTICDIKVDPATGDPNCVGTGGSWCECTSGYFNNNLNAEIIMTSPAMPADVEAQAPVSVQATPAHILVCGHALILGAWMATGKLMNGSRDLESWSADFKSASTDAADAVRPPAGRGAR